MSCHECFLKHFIRNFNQYLNDARLSYACTRLVNSGDTILDICLDSGFDSQRTFNRVFKERYRITPSEYRKIKTISRLRTDFKIMERQDGYSR